MSIYLLALINFKHTVVNAEYDVNLDDMMFDETDSGIFETHAPWAGIATFYDDATVKFDTCNSVLAPDEIADRVSFSASF